MSSLAFNGLPEDILSVSAGAPNGLPIDEINCAVGRADAVISMVMMALSSEDCRPADFVLTDALWSAQSQLAIIRKMVEHADATTTPKRSSSIKLATGA